MASAMRQVFTQRNVMVISITTTMYTVFYMLWGMWFSLYQLELGASIPAVALLTIIRQSSMFLFQFPGGMLADKYGRRKVIIFGTVIRILSPIIYIFARTWEQLIPGMIIEATASVYMPAFNATIAESLPVDRRGTGYGAYRLITSTPMIFVPVVSGIFFDEVGLVKGMMIGFYLSIIVCIIMVITRAILIKETLRPRAVGDRLSTQLTLRESFSALSIIRGSLLAFMIVSVISQFAMQLVMPFLTIYVVEVRGFSKTEWGLISTVSSTILAALSLPSGMVADRFGRRICILIGRLTEPVNRLGLVFSQNLSQLLMLYTITGIVGGIGGGVGGWEMGGPAWQALTADLIPSADRGKVSGLMATLTGLMALPAPYVGGYLWGTFGPDPALLGTVPIGLVGLLIFFFFVKEPKEKAM